MRNLYHFVRFYQEHADSFHIESESNILQAIPAKLAGLQYTEILQSLIAKFPIRLSWTHYSIILQENNAEARAWYENEAANEMWSTRTLQRNVSSQYYHRLLQSQNKEVVRIEMKALTAPLQDK